MSTDWPWADHFVADCTYLGTATCGLPPRATREALAQVHRRWERGRITGPDFDPLIARARQRYARLAGVGEDTVAIGHQASPLVGLVASGLPAGAEVLVPEGEFTSVSFPFAASGARVREAPLARLAEHVTDDTALVAVSAVQSSDGTVADLDAVEAAARHHDADVLVDLTQAIGWLPVDASRYAYTVCAAYKWLLSPRGTAFLTVRPDRLGSVVPSQANWYAGEDPWDSIYGLPLRLAADARRLDVSPGWFSWVGTDASLGFLEQVGTERLHDHAVGLEAAFARAAGLEPAGSAIRSLGTDEEVAAILQRADVVASTRAGRLRVAFHVNNTVAEAERVGALLRGHVWS